ncbi:hypothetical protein CK203_063610 [Vitis vinifera]|uniref:Retrotransposon gag domain-containing protein n=1 Tax=Vitis vinifera TaxID=29760 RepID=A0A438G353_VITVI|nr:hypothetical protein CK203_063610 [Vitis vinifera]
MNQMAPLPGMSVKFIVIPLLSTCDFHHKLDKAKIWLNSLRPRSILSWTDLQAEFLKKFFPTHRTNGLKRQISNFSAKENEKFYECWERYMEAINACPHHGFDTWLLVSYFYDGMSSSMKQLLETMCGGDFMSKNPEEAMDFLSYVADVSRGWDEPTKGEVGKMKSQLNAYNAKAGMYNLKEDDDMKAKLAAMTRRLEELELKRIHEVQAVAEAPVQVKPNNNALMEIPTIQVGGIIQISHGRPEQLNTNSRIHHLSNLQPTPKPHVEKEEEIKKGKEMEDKDSEISEEKKDSDATMKVIPEKELLKEEMLKKSTFPPFPQALHGKKGIRNAAEILEVLRQVKVNIPLLDMIKQVPTYAKFLKDLCTIKRGLTVNKKAFLTEQVSAILQCKSPLKYKDPGSPTISVMIGGKVVEKALLDLGASVNLLPYSVYKQLGLGELKPTAITLSLADRSVKIPRGVIEDVLVQVDNFYYPVDFIVLDTDPTVKEANLVPIILGRPFLATSNAIINCRNGLMQLTFEGILPLFNEEEEAVVEKEIPKLNLKPLPVELKYTYLEVNNQCPIVISSSLTSHQENCLMEVLKRCKKAIGWQISD